MIYIEKLETYLLCTSYFQAHYMYVTKNLFDFDKKHYYL